jgi:non-specific serine/threonine protein kinase
LLWAQGNDAGLSERLQQSLALSEELNYPLGTCFAHVGLGAAALAQGDLVRAEANFQQCRSAAQEADQPIGLYIAAFWLSHVFQVRGDLERAVGMMEEGAGLAQEHGDVWNAGGAAFHLALLYSLRGDHDRATTMMRDLLARHARLESIWCTALAVEGLAWIAAARGESERAARLLGGADALWHRVGATLSVFWQPHREKAMTAIRTRLDATTVSALWAEGETVAPDAIVAYALGDGMPNPDGGTERVPPADPWAPLTAREREVAALIATGLTNRQIAAELSVAERTVHTHVANILHRLGFASRAQVAAWAVQRGST